VYVHSGRVTGHSAVTLSPTFPHTFIQRPEDLTGGHFGETFDFTVNDDQEFSGKKAVSTGF